MADHLIVGGDVLNGVFVLSFFPRDLLEQILDSAESVPLLFCIYQLKSWDFVPLCVACAVRFFVLLFSFYILVNASNSK